jgi:hypothetical protein
VLTTVDHDQQEYPDIVVIPPITVRAVESLPRILVRT